MRRRIPWWARVGLKVAIARVPATYRLWRRLNLFRHGAMDDASYALRVFEQHFARTLLRGRPGFYCLEIGPGDSLSSALIAAAHGAARTYLLDVGAFATLDLAVYRRMAAHLEKCNLRPPRLDNVRDHADLLRACRASYCVHGLRSLREIPSASVDFIWSHAVLEHIRRREFADFVRETYRVLAVDGVCSHVIDLKDHLGGALNNMRISSRYWEAEWMANSGFYTNRLRRSEILRTFREAGFAVKEIASSSWRTLPTPRGALAQEFRELEIEDLLYSEMEVVLTKT